MFGLIGSVKTFSKVLEVGMNVGPNMAYIFVYRFYTKKGVLGVQKNFITSFCHFLAILTIKMADFLKLEVMTDLHILSDPVKNVFFLNYFWAFFIRSTKTQFKHIKYCMVVNWHK